MCLYVNSYGQTRAIRGIVYDKSTRVHIEGVTITPDFFENDSTDERGRFKVYYPRKYKDTIRFSHPDYYPYLTKINDARPNFIHLTPRTTPIDTIFYSVFDRNATLTGRIYDIQTKEELDSIALKIEDNKKVGYTNKYGEFEIIIPLSTNFIVASGNDYKADTLQLSSRDFNKENAIYLFNKNKITSSTKADYYYSNLILFVPNQLLNVAVGLSYVHFINLKHAVGLQSTYYIPGSRPILFSANVNYSGLKISALYRYYFMRNMSNQSYVEGKITGGYFDFKSIPYSYEGYGEEYRYKPANFNSYGFGINWGFEDIVRNSHVVFGFSIGFQYFPMNVETSYIDEHDVTWKTETWWWYLYGPGSIMEIKIYLGGIF
jgi:hypothetical protein